MRASFQRTTYSIGMQVAFHGGPTVLVYHSSRITTPYATTLSVALRKLSLSRREERFGRYERSARRWDESGGATHVLSARFTSASVA